MLLRPPRATRTDTLFPYTTLFRSCFIACAKVRLCPLDKSVLPCVQSVGPAPIQTVGQHVANRTKRGMLRSEEHTSELQSLMRISYAVFCLKKKIQIKIYIHTN